jgi:hypothetical protein
MQTASPDISKQSTIYKASGNGECQAARVAVKLWLIVPFPCSPTSPISFVNAKLRVRPKVQEVHAASREVFEFVRQCAGVGGFHIVLEATAQGALIVCPSANAMPTLGV